MPCHAKPRRWISCDRSTLSGEFQNVLVRGFNHAPTISTLLYLGALRPIASGLQLSTQTLGRSSRSGAFRNAQSSKAIFAHWPESEGCPAFPIDALKAAHAADFTTSD